VILCGFRRVGQNIGKMLDDEDIRYIAIDADHELVSNSQAAGCPVIFGDAALYEILQACRLNLASALVITFNHVPTAIKILQQVRVHNVHISIFVRTLDDTDLERLQALGATEVIPESLETSITMASHLLISMNVSAAKVSALMNKIRKNRYRLLREVIPGEE